VRKNCPISGLGINYAPDRKGDPGLSILRQQWAIPENSQIVQTKQAEEVVKMPRLFGSATMRDLHYKQLEKKLMVLCREVEECEKVEFSQKNKKRLRIALRQLDAAFNNIAYVRG
jgi:hypothetical protein